MAKRQRRSSRSLRGAPSAFATFHDHIEDAQLLVDCARAFDNQRVRRARRELRERFGEALRVKRSDWDALDIVQSSSMAAVFLPASPLGRTRLADLRRLLRPAVVAAAAAVETYLADRVSEQLHHRLRRGDIPPRLSDFTITIADVLAIEEAYTRRMWGIRGHIEAAVAREASADPTKIGRLLSLVDVRDWAKRVDTARGASAGATVSDLKELADRRNSIAHALDRDGRRQRSLSVEEADRFVRIAQIGRAHV